MIYICIEKEGKARVQRFRDKADLYRAVLKTNGFVMVPAAAAPLNTLILSLDVGARKITEKEYLKRGGK